MLKCKQCNNPLTSSPTIRIAVTPGGLADYARLCSWQCAKHYCEDQILQQERSRHESDLAAIKHQTRQGIRRVK